jgi:prepilin-type N-terminal cleavage/methylation domain-containing protein/prepilin-type processing-associated H-X9-DG protein
MKQRGFTLIELLVVIAIIAILAAILFPVFAKAREKARQTSCLNNQRQIASAVLMYVQDNEETFPAATTFWQNMELSEKSLVCPTKGKGANGYVFNVNLSQKALGDIADPTSTLLTADGKDPSNVTYKTSGFNNATDVNVLTAPVATNVAYIPADYNRRHNSLFMASYVDGHVGVSKVAPEVDVDWSGLLTNATPQYTSYGSDSPHTGSTLTSTAGMGWAHAMSKQTMDDGTVSFQFANPTDMMHQVKVVLGDATITVPDNSFGFHLAPTMDVMINFPMMDIAGLSFTASDTFAIRRTGLLVQYLKNGQEIPYTSYHSTFVGPLYVHVFLKGMGTKIVNVTMSGASQ